MKVPRRKFLHLAAGAAALPILPPIAHAQNYPSRPVRIIVGYAAGGPTDIAGRLASEILSKRLGPQFAVEDKRSRQQSLATEYVVNAPPDGYGCSWLRSRTRSTRRSTAISISTSMRATSCRSLKSDAGAVAAGGESVGPDQ